MWGTLKAVIPKLFKPLTVFPGTSCETSISWNILWKMLPLTKLVSIKASSVYGLLTWVLSFFCAYHSHIEVLLYTDLLNTIDLLSVLLCAYSLLYPRDAKMNKMEGPCPWKVHPLPEGWNTIQIIRLKSSQAIWTCHLAMNAQRRVTVYPEGRGISSEQDLAAIHWLLVRYPFSTSQHIPYFCLGSSWISC